MKMGAEKWRMKFSIMNTEVRRLKTIVPIKLNSKVSTSDPNTIPTFIKKNYFV